MKIIPKNVRRFQEGGAMDAAPVEEAGYGEPTASEGEYAEQPEAEGAGLDPVEVLMQMSMQALQNQDCQMAMQVCQVFVQMAQQAQGGGAEPTYARRGGRLYRIR